MSGFSFPSVPSYKPGDFYSASDGGLPPMPKPPSGSVVIPPPPPPRTFSEPIEMVIERIKITTPGKVRTFINEFLNTFLNMMIGVSDVSETLVINKVKERVSASLDKLEAQISELTGDPVKQKTLIQTFMRVVFTELIPARLESKDKFLPYIQYSLKKTNASVGAKRRKTRKARKTKRHTKLRIKKRLIAS